MHFRKQKIALNSKKIKILSVRKTENAKFSSKIFNFCTASSGTANRRFFHRSAHARHQMTVAAPHQPEAIIFYDGDCHLCNRWVVFVLRHDPAVKFQFATLNSQTARARVHDPSLLNGSTVLLLTSEGIFIRSTAVLMIAAQLPGY